MKATYQDPDRSLTLFTVRALVVIFSAFGLLVLSAFIPIAICLVIAYLLVLLGFNFVALVMVLGFPFTIASTLRGMWILMFRRPKPEIGLLIDLNEEPSISAFLQEICTTLGSKMPQAVIVHTEPKLAVFQGKVRCINGKANGRVLIIGMPILGGLDPTELRSVLVHEFAHFTGSDTLYSGFVMPAYKGLHRAITKMRNLSTKEIVRKPSFRRWISETFFMFFKLPSALPVPSLTFLFRQFWKREQNCSWAREFRADRIASEICGSQLFSTSLVRTIQLTKAFDSYVKGLLPEQLNDTSFALYSSFFHCLGHSQPMPSDSALVVKTIEEESDFSHPSLASRLASLPKSCSGAQKLDFDLKILHQNEYDDTLSQVFLRAFSFSPHPDSEAGAPEQESQASFGQRICAASIDTVVVILVLAVGYSLTKPLGELLFLDNAMPPSAGLAASHGNLFLDELFLLPWLYFAILESSWKQGTIGKILMGISVCDIECRRISFGRASARFFSLILQPGYGLLNVLTSKNRQALWDLWPGCKMTTHRKGSERVWSWRLGKLFLVWLLFGTLISLAIHIGPPDADDFSKKFDWNCRVGWTMDSLDLIGLIKARIYAHLGRHRLNSSKPGVALQYFEDAARARPDLPEFRLDVAEADYVLKRYDDATLALGAAENMSSERFNVEDFPWGQPELVENLLSSKAGRSVVDLLRDVFDSRSLDSVQQNRALALRTDLYLATDKYESAIITLRYHLDLEPTRQDLQSKLALAQYKLALSSLGGDSPLAAFDQYDELRQQKSQLADELKQEIEEKLCHHPTDTYVQYRCREIRERRLPAPAVSTPPSPSAVKRTVESIHWRGYSKPEHVGGKWKVRSLAISGEDSYYVFELPADNTKIDGSQSGVKLTGGRLLVGCRNAGAGRFDHGTFEPPLRLSDRNGYWFESSSYPVEIKTDQIINPSQWEMNHHNVMGLSEDEDLIFREDASLRSILDSQAVELRYEALKDGVRVKVTTSFDPRGMDKRKVLFACGSTAVGFAEAGDRTK